MSELLITQENGRLQICLNRPGKHNALRLGLLDALGALLREKAMDTSIKLAVITGAGQASFAAGGDLHELDAVRSSEAATQMSRRGMHALNAVRDFPVPVVAALNGSARGGGAELAMACDLRWATASAKIGFIQATLNIATAWGGGTDLVNKLGGSRALAILNHAKMYDAQQAQALGLIDAVWADECFADKTQQTLNEWCEKPVQVMRAHKALLRARDADAREGMQAQETAHCAATWVHDDHWRAAQRAFPLKQS